MGKVEPREAEEKLLAPECKKGYFLVRDSENEPGMICLLFMLWLDDLHNFIYLTCITSLS